VGSNYSPLISCGSFLPRPLVVKATKSLLGFEGKADTVMESQMDLGHNGIRPRRLNGRVCFKSPFRIRDNLELLCRCHQWNNKYFPRKATHYMGLGSAKVPTGRARVEEPASSLKSRYSVTVAGDPQKAGKGTLLEWTQCGKKPLAEFATEAEMEGKGDLAEIIMVRGSTRTAPHAAQRGQNRFLQSMPCSQAKYLPLNFRDYSVHSFRILFSRGQTPHI